ncbi:MAG: hypothetical protein AMXMBFR84_08440 [Candidatus Hydrogenedentota bacterium]
MNCIGYKAGYKYQLAKPYSISTGIIPVETIQTEYLHLSLDGTLTIRAGYAWDGPSGPTFDTANFMRGSLVHDAFYQLMREDCLKKERYRDQADRLLQRMCREDGMSAIRSWFVYQAVSRFADPAADPANRRMELRAPEDCSA